MKNLLNGRKINQSIAAQLFAHAPPEQYDSKRLCVARFRIKAQVRVIFSDNSVDILADSWKKLSRGNRSNLNPVPMDLISYGDSVLIQKKNQLNLYEIPKKIGKTWYINSMIHNFSCQLIVFFMQGDKTWKKSSRFDIRCWKTLRCIFVDQLPK